MIKSDGNGGYNKGAFTMIMVLIALISCIATAVAYTVSIRSDVSWLKQEWQSASQNHPIIINDLDDRIGINEKDIVSNEEKIIALQDDITEIKDDVKELLKR